MTTPEKSCEVEELSAKLHEIYQIEARRQGDVRHHDDYNQLKESTKEYDRVLARYILSRELEKQKIIEDLRAALEKIECQRFTIDSCFEHEKSALCQPPYSRYCVRCEALSLKQPIEKLKDEG